MQQKIKKLSQKCLFRNFVVCSRALSEKYLPKFIFIIYPPKTEGRVWVFGAHV